jgi:hypothetical protein
MTDAKNFKIIFYDKDDCEHLVKYGSGDIVRIHRGVYRNVQKEI